MELSLDLPDRQTNCPQLSASRAQSRACSNYAEAKESPQLSASRAFRQAQDKHPSRACSNYAEAKESPLLIFLTLLKRPKPLFP